MQTPRPVKASFRRVGSKRRALVDAGKQCPKTVGGRLVKLVRSTGCANELAVS